MSHKYNTLVWETDDKLYAEWSDRAPDDDDRYAEDSILLTVSVDINGDEKEMAEKRLWTKFCNAYDAWYDETRRV